MSILLEIKDRIKYFEAFRINYQKVPGSHDSDKEIRTRLGYVMKKLKESDHNEPIVDEYLKEIHGIMELKYPLDIFQKQYEIYLRLLSDREDFIEEYNRKSWIRNLSPIQNLRKTKWNKWGSHKQFMFGKFVVDAINEKYNYNLHPIWGAMLNPTGGMIGPGNKELIEGLWNSYLGLHACIHDASGYLYTYHQIGNCGYNYLNTWKTLFPKWSSLSCQIAGISFWRKVCDPNTDCTPCDK